MRRKMRRVTTFILAVVMIFSFMPFNTVAIDNIILEEEIAAPGTTPDMPYARFVDTPPAFTAAMDPVWESTYAVQINDVFRQMAGSAFPATGVGRILWDADNLYVRVDVLDSSVRIANVTSNQWESDSVEVFVSEPNFRGPNPRDGVIAGQYRVSPNNNRSGEFGNNAWTSEAFHEGATGGGYTVFFSIPWMNAAVPKIDGTVIGFDFQINDSLTGAGNSNRGITVWSARDTGWGSTMDFAELLLWVPPCECGDCDECTPGILLMSLVMTEAVESGAANRFDATGGKFADVSSLTAWNNNERIVIGGTGRTPIVINNGAVNNNPTGGNGWRSVGAAAIDAGITVDTATAFQIEFSTLGYDDIRLTCRQKSTGSGPEYFALAYSLTGPTGPFIPIAGTKTASMQAPPAYTTNTYADLDHPAGVTFLNFPLPSEVANQERVFLRVYMVDSTLANRANGNTSINDIHISSGPIDVGFEKPIIVVPGNQALSFSREAGMFAGAFDLTITNLIGNGVIRYTIDGTNPTADSPVFPASLHVSDRSSQPNYWSNLFSETGSGDPRLLPHWTRLGFTTYRNPGPVFKATVVKAQLFDHDGNPLSTVVTNTYVIDRPDPFLNLPIISVTGEKDDFFSIERGIFVRGSNVVEEFNFYQRGAVWERPVFFEFFEPDGSRQVAHNMGVRIHGGWSRDNPMKSMRFYNSTSRDPNHPLVTYDIFQGGALDVFGNPIPTFRRFIARNFGNDWAAGDMRDKLGHRLAQGLNMAVQGSRYVVVMFNGEFWGLYELRERIDVHMVGSNYNVNDGNVAVFENPHPDRGGIDGDDLDFPVDNQLFLEMGAWFRANPNIADPALYEIAQTFIDIDNFIDLFITRMFVDDHDWPNNNMRWWRYQTSTYPAVGTPNHARDGRWRLIFNDVDQGFSRYGTNHAHNAINRLFTGSFAPGGANEWSTLFFRVLLTNPDFARQFVNRYFDIINTHFDRDVVDAKITELVNTISAIQPTYRSRWFPLGGSSNWDNQVNIIRTFNNQRRANVVNHLTATNAPISYRAFFGPTGADSIGRSEWNLTLQTADTSQGFINLNNMDMLYGSTPGVADTTNTNWTGRYLNTFVQTITAVPRAGYEFSYFMVGSERVESNPLLLTMPSANTTVVAVFEESTAVNREVIAEFRYTRQTATAIQPAYPATGGILYRNAKLEFFYANGTQANLGRSQADREPVNVPNNAAGWFPLTGDITAQNSAGWVITLGTGGFGNLTFTADQGSSNNGPRDFNLAYRVGNSGAWTEIGGETPHASVLSAADTIGNTFNGFALPAGMDNQSEVQLKIYISSRASRGTGTFDPAGGNTSMNNIIVSGERVEFVCECKECGCDECFPPDGKCGDCAICNAANVPFTAVLPTIADDTAWADALVLELNLPAQTTLSAMHPAGVPAATAVAELLWDFENLYVRIQVDDNTPFTASGQHTLDSIEFFLAEDNVRGPQGQGWRNQYRIARSGAYSFHTATPTTALIGLDANRRMVQANDEGYTILLAIPLLRDGGPVNMQQMLFDIMINDANAVPQTFPADHIPAVLRGETHHARTRTAQVSWHDIPGLLSPTYGGHMGFQNSNGWGEIILVGAPAKHYVTTTAGFGGSVMPGVEVASSSLAGKNWVAANATPSFTITPAIGYLVDTVLINGVPAAPAIPAAGGVVTFPTVTNNDNTLDVTFVQAAGARELDFIVFNDVFADGEYTTAVIIDLGAGNSIRTDQLNPAMFTVSARNTTLSGAVERFVGTRNITRVYANTVPEPIGYLSPPGGTPGTPPASGRYIVIELQFFSPAGGYAYGGQTRSGSNTMALNYSIIANAPIGELSSVVFRQDRVVSPVLDRFVRGTGPQNHSIALDPAWEGDGPGYRNPLPLFVYHHGMGRNGASLATADGCIFAPLRSANGAAMLSKLQLMDPERFGGVHIIATHGNNAPNTIALIRQLIEEEKVDPNRVYMSGFSAGAATTINVLRQAPELLAAIVPVGSAERVTQAQVNARPEILDVPVWYIVHLADRGPGGGGSFADNRIRQINTVFDTVTYEGRGFANANLTTLVSNGVIGWPYFGFDFTAHESETAAFGNLLGEMLAHCDIFPATNGRRGSDQEAFADLHIFDWLFAQSREPVEVPELTITFHLYTANQRILDAFGDYATDVIDGRAKIVVPVVPGRAPSTWEGFAALSGLGHIYGTTAQHGYAFWGWFDDEMLDGSARVRGGLRRPALTLAGEVACPLADLLEQIENATVAEMVELFGDGNIDLYGVWVRFGDVDDSSQVNMTDLNLLQRHINFGHLLPMYFSGAAADVVVDGVVNMTDLSLLQRHTNLGHIITVVLGERPQ